MALNAIVDVEVMMIILLSLSKVYTIVTYFFLFKTSMV